MTYFFKSKKDAVEYVFSKLDNPTPIKLQKALYFVWAFYAATYGNMNSDNSENKDSGISYPNFLFEPNFEAWQYGPVDPDVWKNNSNDEYESTDVLCNPRDFIDIKNKSVYAESVYKDIFSFIDDMISQVNSVNDFGLVNRSHEDSAWKDVWDGHSPHIQMDPQKIKKDYIGYINEQSKI